MEVVRRICLHDQVIIDGATEFRLERGREYITSRIKVGDDDKPILTVYSSYWVSGIPMDWFGGAEPEDGE